MLIADLAKLSALRGVQRERLEEVLREQQLQSLEICRSNGRTIGHLSGINALLSGSVSMIGSIVRIDGSLVSRELFVARYA